MLRMRTRTRVDGVLLIDKPVGITSNQALGWVKRLFNATKAGHTGTLDPFATGLLPVCLGEATKFSADLLDADKAYRATIRFGQTTTTGDLEGEVLETRTVDLGDAPRAKLEAALQAFRGPISQVPPMYSALKRDGKPLYEYARAGITLERVPRAVTIHQLDLEELSLTAEATTAVIHVRCSKGTYIRTLAEDIGAALGCGAHLIALRRTQVGPLDLTQAVTLDALEALEKDASPEEPVLARRLKHLLPVDALLTGLPLIQLNEAQTRKFGQGQALADLPCAHVEGALVRVLDTQGALLGTAAWVQVRQEWLLQPKRLVVAPA